MTNLTYSYSNADVHRIADRPARRVSITIVWWLFIAGLILSPIGDFLSVVSTHGSVPNGSDARFSLLVRGVMVSGLIAATFLSGKVRPFSWCFAVLTLVAVVAAGIAYALDNMSAQEFAEQVVLVFKVVSFFVYFNALSGLNDKRLSKLDPLIQAALLVYALAIVAGAMLSIDMFRSYQADTQIRSGYKGIVNAQNEASALLIVGLAYAYLGVLRFGWRAVNVVLVGSMLLASMLVGTKGAAIGALGVTCAYYYARHNVLGATWRAGLIISLLLCAAILAYLAIPNVHQAVDLSLRYFSHQSGRAGGDKLLTVLLSGRNLKFEEVWRNLSNDNYIEILTGGYPVMRYMVEIDIPDLILTFGLPIFIVYFMALRRTFIYRSRRDTARFGRLFFLVLIAVASTAGHILDSAVIGPYLAIIAVLVGRTARSFHAKD